MVGVVLLAVAATRAAAQDGDFDDGGTSDLRRETSDLRREIDDRAADEDDLGDALTGGNDGKTVSRTRRSSLAFAHGSTTSASSGTAGFQATDAAAGIAIEGAPPLSDVVAATLRASGLADDPVPGWRTRSRWSALVPAVTSRVGNSESWREVTDPTVSRALSYDIRVSWRLERLIYDPNEPRFAAFDISRRRERRRLIALATHAYIEWLHARAAELAVTEDAEARDYGAETGTSRSAGAYAADAAGAPAASGNAGAARRATRILIEARQAHAELDALTDGWFSQVLNKTRSR